MKNLGVLLWQTMNPIVSSLIAIFYVQAFPCSLACAAEPPRGIVKWLETSSKYEDLECDVKRYSVKSDGKLSLEEAGQIKVIFDSRSYWERMTKESPVWTTTTESSHVGRLTRSILKSQVDRKTGKQKDQKGPLGSISEIKRDAVDRRDFLHPGYFFGYIITIGMAEWQDISDVMTKAEIVEGGSVYIGEPGVVTKLVDAKREFVVDGDDLSFTFKDVFGWKSDGVENIFVCLSKEHDYLPKRISTFTSNEANGVVKGFMDIHVTEFVKYKELWFPVKYEIKGKAKFEISSVKLNSSLRDEDLVAVFPEKVSYLDERDNGIYLDGVYVKQNGGNP